MDLGKIFGNSNGNLEIHSHNLSNEIYQEELKQNSNIILKKFKTKLNKNLEDDIGKDELLKFLDSCNEVIF